MCQVQRVQMAACGDWIIVVQRKCFAAKHRTFSRTIRKLSVSHGSAIGSVCEQEVAGEDLVRWGLCGACHGEYASKGIFGPDALRQAEVDQRWMTKVKTTPMDRRRRDIMDNLRGIDARLNQARLRHNGYPPQSLIESLLGEKETELVHLRNVDFIQGRIPETRPRPAITAAEVVFEITPRKTRRSKSPEIQSLDRADHQSRLRKAFPMLSPPAKTRDRAVSSPLPRQQRPLLQGSAEYHDLFGEKPKHRSLKSILSPRKALRKISDSIPFHRRKSSLGKQPELMSVAETQGQAESQSQMQAARRISESSQPESSRMAEERLARRAREREESQRHAQAQSHLTAEELEQRRQARIASAAEKALRKARENAEEVVREDATEQANRRLRAEFGAPAVESSTSSTDKGKGKEKERKR